MKRKLTLIVLGLMVLFIAILAIRKVREPAHRPVHCARTPKTG